MGYGSRDKHLQELGYSSYSAYLNSPLWHNISARAWAMHGHACVVCGNGAKALHHVSYRKSVLLGMRQELRFIVPVCARCHLRIEFKEDGTKRMLREAQAEFWKLCPGFETQRRHRRKRHRGSRPEIGLAFKARHLARKARQRD